MPLIVMPCQWFTERDDTRESDHASASRPPLARQFGAHCAMSRIIMFEILSLLAQRCLRPHPSRVAPDEKQTKSKVTLNPSASFQTTSREARSKQSIDRKPVWRTCNLKPTTLETANGQYVTAIRPHVSLLQSRRDYPEPFDTMNL